MTPIRKNCPCPPAVWRSCNRLRLLHKQSAANKKATTLFSISRGLGFQKIVDHSKQAENTRTGRSYSTMAKDPDDRDLEAGQADDLYDVERGEAGGVMLPRQREDTPAPEDAPRPRANPPSAGRGDGGEGMQRSQERCTRRRPKING